MPSYFQTRQAEERAEKAKKAPRKKAAKKVEPLPDDLGEMSLKDLKSLAAEMDIPGRSSMNKKQLVKALG